ncbi:PLD nuclease N-terminal domain-containing protein [Halobacillus sp. Marseille-Q1614]|uniref:PLD nuclease N-terminal domain-containing protein n=1 Tax=Halobacillus sp. Marseille-Q1614 TaxID=2709134 RepID=UPI00156DDFFA|nr:PLD nuclease N-terminal domain-containing protein [Halobacillus sp. Marseille-Q1614]
MDQTITEFIHQNLALLAPVIAIQLILMVIAIVSLIKAEYTNGPKWVWALIILFINILGPIAYFIFGRRD